MDFSRYSSNNRGRRRQIRHALICTTTIALLGWLCAAQPARADNPGYDRPGYGFTPVVLGPGDITLEQGLPDWSLTKQDGATSAQYTADSLLRIGLGDSLELQLGSSPWNALRQTGNDGVARYRGHGDSSLGLKLALPSSATSFSWGLLASVEFTDGAQAFRSDRRQYLFGAQFNLQVNERNGLGLYLQDVRNGGLNNTTLALGDNYSLSRTLALYVETVALHAPDQGNGTLAGAGLTWMINPRVQLDAGFDHRLGGVAPRWQSNLGVSIYFGR
ncbi:transporter [Rhodanobacter sp. AS-Z3]|uniref:transporter n=1 Tax=Rhodanobacter sp. AS-Z3 TaxID=3031330 RepID=UPI00247A583A|nr:transporter [Rhodanobacter sp. AS-Z3]WEN13405.1 transporter [Rhodanobacter sp. AS-Z3]